MSSNSFLSEISNCQQLESKLADLKRQKRLADLKNEFADDPSSETTVDEAKILCDWNRTLGGETHRAVESSLRESFVSKENRIAVRREEAVKLKDIAETLSSLKSSWSSFQSDLSRNRSRDWSEWASKDLKAAEEQLLRKEAEMAKNEEKAKAFGKN